MHMDDSGDAAPACRNLRSVFRLGLRFRFYRILRSNGIYGFCAGIFFRFHSYFDRNRNFTVQPYGYLVIPNHFDRFFQVNFAFINVDFMGERERPGE